MTDPYDVIVTRRTEPWIDPRPVDFTCAICERDIHVATWRVDGRSRQIAPICTNCEQSYGGNPLSSWRGARMDARIARRVNAAAVFLSCLAHRSKHERKRNGS